MNTCTTVNIADIKVTNGVSSSYRVLIFIYVLKIYAVVFNFRATDPDCSKGTEK